MLLDLAGDGPLFAGLVPDVVSIPESEPSLAWVPTTRAEIEADSVRRLSGAGLLQHLSRRPGTCSPSHQFVYEAVLDGFEDSIEIDWASFRERVQAVQQHSAECRLRVARGYNERGMLVTTFSYAVEQQTVGSLLDLSASFSPVFTQEGFVGLGEWFRRIATGDTIQMMEMLPVMQVGESQQWWEAGFLDRVLSRAWNAAVTVGRLKDSGAEITASDLFPTHLNPEELLHGSGEGAFYPGLAILAYFSRNLDDELFRTMDARLVAPLGVAAVDIFGTSGPF